MKKCMIVIAAMAMLMLTGCRQTQENKTKAADNGIAWYENDSALQADLAAAIEDAKVIDSVEVVNDLTPVKKDYPGEEWANFDGRDMVLVVTLVDSSRLQRFFSGEGVYRIDREMGTWVSLPVDWVNRSAAFEGLDSVAAHMRLIQMYGLDPTCDYDIMVSFYADPATMFRPTPDPDITTTTATTEFPKHVDENFKIGETNFREWYRYSVEAAYEDDSPLPWTQMGYTYDWHEGAPHQGLSEYVVGHHTWIKVKSRQKVSEFISGLLK